jgi:hypothetical protein
LLSSIGTKFFFLSKMSPSFTFFQVINNRKIGC